ncbi:putative Histone-lysine N-methyltransferase Smyd1 [Hypsibius exemplaris]|uniref:Histone-lysine N-methyltransferase Smyd1 n=1 Tax=Hypsibius exemplaris TaxID=2072580 RepID=A0A1W0X3L4_HYPEX|nr:putative Histone-lysine N-methyltransferase Smyd1 [Hypsibius exemplaris]
MSYQKGDIIMRNRPWAYVLEDKHKSAYCHFCFRRPIEKADQKLRRCTQCLFAHYCDGKCAKSAWKDHKVECNRLSLALKSGADIPECNIRLLARILMKLARGERSDPPDACIPPSERTYDSLCTHADQIESSVLQITAFTYIIEKLVAFLGKENMPTDKNVLKNAYSKLIVNAMTLYDGAWPYGIGAALPLGATRFDHACKPNADYMIRDGCQIVVTALEDIASIEDVRICYCNSMEMTPQRRATLKEHYYFECQCAFCLDENRDNMMRSLWCPEKGCGGAIPCTAKFIPLPCTKCRMEMTGKDTYVRGAVSLLSEINEKVAAYTALFENAESSPELVEQQKASNQEITQLYHKIKSTIHPLNVFYIKLAVHLADHDSPLGWKLYLEETEAYRYYHGFSAFLGIRLVLQGGFQLASQLLDEAAKSLEEAETILRVTHGKDHPVYKDMLNVKDVQIPQMKHLQHMTNKLPKMPKS